MSVSICSQESIEKNIGTLISCNLLLQPFTVRGESGIGRGRVQGAIRSRRAGRAAALIRIDICIQRRARCGVFQRFRIEIVIVVEIPIIIIVRHWRIIELDRQRCAALYHDVHSTPAPGMEIHTCYNRVQAEP